MPYREPSSAMLERYLGASPSSSPWPQEIDLGEASQVVYERQERYPDPFPDPFVYERQEGYPDPFPDLQFVYERQKEDIASPGEETASKELDNSKAAILNPKQANNHVSSIPPKTKQKVHHEHLEMSRPRQVSRIESRSSLQEHCVELKLDCLTVMAFPDTCSAANIISEQFLHDHDICFDDQHRHTLKLPNGKQLNSLGTADLTFRVGDDDSLHLQSFTVIRNCVHDIILGSWFLRKIELFTKFSNHLKWVPRIFSARTSRVCLIESPQQAVTGSIDGHFVSAAPDTGSDVNLVSMEYAEKFGLRPITDSRGVIKLEFIDGSTALTCGLIADVEWKFDENEEAAETSSQQRTLAKSRPAVVHDWDFGTNATTTDVYVCDFYVLENLTIPIILSSDLLLGSNAFKACARNFRPFVQPTKRPREPEDADIFYIRTQNKRRSLRSLFRHESVNTPQLLATHSPDLAAFENEVRRRGDEADRIAELPPNERAAAQDAENRRIHSWDLHQRPLQAGNVQQPSQQPLVQQSSTQAQSLPAQSQLQPQPSNAGR